MNYTKLELKNLYICAVNLNIMSVLWDVINPTNAKTQPLNPNQERFSKELFREFLGFNSPSGKNRLDNLINGNASTTPKIDANYISKQFNVSEDYFLGKKLLRIDVNTKNKQEIMKMILDPIITTYSNYKDNIILKKINYQDKTYWDNLIKNCDCLNVDEAIIKFFYQFENDEILADLCFACISEFHKSIKSSNKVPFKKILYDLYKTEVLNDIALGNIIYKFKNNKKLELNEKIQSYLDYLKSFDYDSIGSNELGTYYDELNKLLTTVKIIYDYKKLKNK